MSELVVLAGGWLLVLIAFLSFLTLRRYMEHRERMAMIMRGITPPDKRRNTLPRLARRTGVLQGGLITAMVGLALTLGLYPVGFLVPPSLATPNHFGPWLLAGLIPLAVGIALILGHYLTPGRPIETSAGEREHQPDTLTDAPGEASAASASAGGPIALPEARHWAVYRRESAAASERALESDEERDEEAHSSRG